MTSVSYLVQAATSSKEEIPLIIRDVSPLPHYLATQHERKDQFVFLKQAPETRSQLEISSLNCVETKPEVTVLISEQCKEPIRAQEIKFGRCKGRENKHEDWAFFCLNKQRPNLWGEVITRRNTKRRSPKVVL